MELRSGVAIADPLAEILDFIRRDGSYQSYDLVPVDPTAPLDEPDVRVANRIIARMGQATIDAIVARGPVIDEALAAIPVESSLVADDADMPWDELHRLFAAFDGVPAVGLPRITKVLHKKRPALIPILDEVVQNYLVSVEPRPTGDRASQGVAFVRAYKRELDHVLPSVQCLRRELQSRAIDLIECRILDIALWALSGTYEPLWRRTETSARPGRPHAEGVAVVISDGSLDVFIDDDDGYLGWLRTHPRGFVLNCGRTPKPDYLKLHQATCSTITRMPTRGTTWTGPYIKLCAVDSGAIVGWCRGKMGSDPQPCGICRPQVNASS